jgi:hypothetical protein
MSQIDKLNVSSGEYRRDYLALSGVYATWGEANPWGQLLILGADKNENTSAGNSFDMGLQDGAAYGIAAVGFYGDDDGDDLGSQWARLVEAQIGLTVSQTGDTTIMGVRGCVAFNAGVDWSGSFCSGVEGQIEFLGATDLGNASDIVGVSAGRFIVSMADDCTVGRENVLSGVRAELSVASGKTVTQTGSSGSLVEGALAAFAAVGKTGTAGDNWDDGLYLDRVNNAIGFRAVDSSYSCGVAAQASTPGGNTSHAIRVNLAGTAGYIPVYAAATF